MPTTDASAALASLDVASSPPTTDLPAAWHRQLVSVAKGIVNNEARRLNFAERAGAADVTRRLNGYAWKLWGQAAPHYDTLWQIAEYAIDQLSREGYQPSLPGFCESQRKKSILGVRAKASQVKERNEGILEARAAGQPVKAIANQYSVSEATVKRVATPLAVAAWRQHQKVSEPISPPHPNDLSSDFSLLKSSICELEMGSDTDIAWIVDTWTAKTGEHPSRRQALQLAAWADAGLDDGSIVDLVRMIRYAAAKRDPWAYVSSSMSRLGGEPECWHCLQQRASAKQVQYSQYARDPRAYLATCVRNEPGPAPPADLNRRTGYLNSYRKRYGSLPWEPKL